MKYRVQTGITPQFIMINKLTDVADAEDEDKAEVRRKVTDFIRKIIAGAFAVRTCDYFRVASPQRDDYLHIDPISLTCAVIDRARTFGVMLSLNKIGLQMPASLAGIWETKLKSSMLCRVGHSWKTTSNLSTLLIVTMHDTRITWRRLSTTQSVSRPNAEDLGEDESSWRTTERGMRAGIIRLL